MIKPEGIAIDISKDYDFSKEAISEIQKNTWVRNQWPLLYFISNNKNKIGYVGESTNFQNRLKSHLANEKKAIFDRVSIIGSDKFNKSATLDIESKLIQYISAEGTFTLQNANTGLVNHNYYQQDVYKNLFKEIWEKLQEKKIITRSLDEIENSELFKYSPYKSLSDDQYSSVLAITEALSLQNNSSIFVEGTSGTGKTILATYLIKLLLTEPEEREPEDLNEYELLELDIVKKFRKIYPKPEIGLVIAMSSLRKTLKTVFDAVPGLKSSMVISPSDTFKKSYDLLIVDESHRLRRYKNISWMGVFKKNNEKLGLDESGTEFDWIKANSKNQIFFYDENQSVKPSDIQPEVFKKHLNDPNTLKFKLESQMRVRGGQDYIGFVSQLLQNKLPSGKTFHQDDYELLLFDSMKDLYQELTKREEKFGLCRLIAGYAWPWQSNPKSNPKPGPEVTDIQLDGLAFKWNSVDQDWINSPNAFREVGCIHTTQGYDLNFAGIIFGKEITYNKFTSEIEIRKENYFDKNGKKGIKDSEALKNYIINIYKTIMYRGIRGTFIYACDEELREYLKKHIPVFKPKTSTPFRRLNEEDIKPWVNSVPLLDITAAAGNFSDLQVHQHLEWVELPEDITVKPGYFICKIIGESMNKLIPNGSWCLFQQDPGGSRQGKIVLAQHFSFKESGLGAGYTIKEYHSEKKVTEDGWEHTTITLTPKSTDPKYQNIELQNEELSEFKVVGVLVKVIHS